MLINQGLYYGKLCFIIGQKSDYGSEGCEFEPRRVRH